jgi:hypothetical protein
MAVVMFEDGLAFPTPTNIHDQVAQLIVIVGTGASVIASVFVVVAAAAGWL